MVFVNAQGFEVFEMDPTGTHVKRKTINFAFNIAGACAETSRFDAQVGCGDVQSIVDVAIDHGTNGVNIYQFL